MKILAVDKDKKLADSLNNELKEALVYHVADGEVGLKIALEKQFDLIVMDWELPSKDGLTVLKELREQKVLTPILMLMAEDSAKDVVLSLDSCANDCLIKPFEIHVLIARMKALIRRSKWDLCAEMRHDHIIPEAVISILIEDDNEFSREALARLVTLKLPDVVVHATHCPQTRLEICSNHKINIVIADVNKPSVNITNMVESTRLVSSNTKFIVITGTSEEEKLRNIASISNTWLVNKPVDFGELIAAIKSIIAQIYVEQTECRANCLRSGTLEV